MCSNISKGQVSGIYIQETISILIFEMKTSIAAFWQGKIVWVGVSITLVDAPAAASSRKAGSSRLREGERYSQRVTAIRLPNLNFIRHFVDITSSVAATPS